jgi:hypothetical protein
MAWCRGAACCVPTIAIPFLSFFRDSTFSPRVLVSLLITTLLHVQKLIYRQDRNHILIIFLVYSNECACFVL